MNERLDPSHRSLGQDLISTVEGENSFFGTHSSENSLKRLEFQGAAWREERSGRCMKGTISKESRARKPRKGTATINAGPYC